jgi:hypothetical protein
VHSLFCRVFLLKTNRGWPSHNMVAQDTLKVRNETLDQIYCGAAGFSGAFFVAAGLGFQKSGSAFTHRSGG